MLEERLGNIVCNATANFIIKFLNYLEYEKKYSSHTIIAYREDIFSFFSFLSDNENKNITQSEKIKNKKNNKINYQINKDNIIRSKI